MNSFCADSSCSKISRHKTWIFRIYKKLD